MKHLHSSKYAKVPQSLVLVFLLFLGGSSVEEPSREGKESPSVSQMCPKKLFSDDKVFFICFYHIW
jgi:hypothetical protein